MPSGSPLQKRQGQGSAALPPGAGVSHHFVTRTVPSNLPLLGLRPKIALRQGGRASWSQISPWPLEGFIIMGNSQSGEEGGPSSPATR